MLAAAALCLLLPSAGHAMRVSPMLLDMEASGAGASQSVRVENPGDSTIAVEFRPERRTWDAEGKETKTLDEGAFVVFPPQALIKPKGTQVFRVQWAGQGDLKETASYHLNVDQLPVKVAKEGQDHQGFQFLMTFSLVVNVSPVGVKPELSVLSSKAENGKVAFSVENKGDRYAYLTHQDVSAEYMDASGKAVKYTFPQEAMREALGDTIIPPHSKRHFDLVLPQKPGTGEITVHVSGKP